MPILNNILGGLKDTFTHPFPTAKPHAPTDPLAVAVSGGTKVSIHQLAVNSGTDWDAGIATAIALAESRGQIGAVHHNADGSDDLGLMQINNKAHPQYNRQRLLTDAQYNMDAAHDIWKASGWGAWTTFKTGAFRAFLGHDAQVNQDPGAGTRYAGIAPAASSGIDVIGNVVGALGNPSTWARLGKGTLGGVLVIMGVAGITFIAANKVPTPAKQVARTLK